MKIGPGVSELWGVENRPLPLTWPMAYTTACTTVQAVMCNWLFENSRPVDFAIQRAHEILVLQNAQWLSKQYHITKFASYRNVIVSQYYTVAAVITVNSNWIWNLNTVQGGPV